MNSKKLIKSLSLLLIIMLASMSLVSAIMPVEGTGEVAISNDGVQITGHANLQKIATKIQERALARVERTKVCTQDAKKCPDGHYVGRDSTKNCSFFSCENEDVVCCRITPVIPNSESKYSFVSKDSCIVSKDLGGGITKVVVGINKVVVDDSFCEKNNDLKKLNALPLKEKLIKSKRLVISVGHEGNPLKQLRDSETGVEVTSVRLLPGSNKMLIKTGDEENELNISEGFEMRFNRNNVSQLLKIRSVGNLWNEITDEDWGNESKDLTKKTLKVRTRAIIRASENGLSVELKNGSAKQIKVLPLQASERAREVLKANFDDVVLKETNGKVIYQMKAHQRMKFLGLFPMNASLSAEVDADSGDVLKVKKPWFSFLSSKPKLSASVNLDAETVESNSSLEN